MEVIKLINKIRGTDFECPPEVYRDFEVVNAGNKRNKYLKILSEGGSVQYLVKSISNNLKIDTSFAAGCRGVLNAHNAMLNIIKRDTFLKKYNMIPTISLMPLFLTKEEKVIPIYNDAISVLISNGTTKPCTVNKESDILILTEAFSKYDINDIMPMWASVLMNLYDNDKEKIITKLANHDIYIVNAVALASESLLYYPIDRSEYEKESVYNLVNPECLCILSLGLENSNVSAFVRTALSLRHSTDKKKKTLIETPLSYSEFSRLYRFNDKKVFQLTTKKYAN